MIERFPTPADLIALDRPMTIISPDVREQWEVEGWRLLSNTREGDLLMYLPENPNE